VIQVSYPYLVSGDMGMVAAFAIAAGFLTITPGLDTALVLRTAAVEGAGQAPFALAGICIGLFIWGSATALGLTALLAASVVAYNILRIVGAAYLVYLGVRMWRREHTFEVAGGDGAGKMAGHRWLWRGLLTNILNPKVGVFYVTLLPQFIPSGGSVIGYSLLFTSIHVAEGVLWLTILTMAVRPLRAWLTRPSVVRALDCGTGTVLIGCGVALALERRR
jgi:threonine/homoserine/homoserine lactone efflux protein